MLRMTICRFFKTTSSREDEYEYRSAEYEHQSFRANLFRILARGLCALGGSQKDLESPPADAITTQRERQGARRRLPILNGEHQITDRVGDHRRSL